MDEGMSTDLRAAILARCDELERLARAAAEHEGGGAWMVDVRDSVAAHFVMADLMVDDELTMVIASDVPCQTAEHFAAWDPAAVLELVAGAREMCEVHTPRVIEPYFVYPDHVRNPDNDDCEGCGYADGAEWLRNTIGDCPSLRATARMLGVEVTPDV